MADATSWLGRLRERMPLPEFGAFWDELRSAAERGDGDAEGWQTTWTVNGAAAGTGDVLTAGTYHRGDTIGYTLVPDDGELTGTAVIAADVVVENSAPACTSAAVTIGDDGLTVEGTATVLSTDFLGCDDADGDLLTWIYDWQVDGVSVSTDTTLPVATYATRDQDIVLVLAYTDGFEIGASAVSNTLTVANALPVATASISPSPLYANSTATATGAASDADGDSVSLTYAWTIDGVASGTGSTLAGFSRGQTVALTVTPSDGVGTGSPSTTSVVVSNSAPAAPSVTLYPTAPGNDDAIVCSISAAATDADGRCITNP